MAKLITRNLDDEGAKRAEGEAHRTRLPTHAGGPAGAPRFRRLEPRRCARGPRRGEHRRDKGRVDGTSVLSTPALPHARPLPPLAQHTVNHSSRDDEPVWQSHRSTW
jgi:hypothetical protein